MDEKVFKYNNHEIIYTLSRNTTSNVMIVVFSGCAKLYENDKHPYNFQNVLSSFPANVLYIRDNIGNRGVYYLAYKGDFSVSEGVCELIKKISSECNVSANNIITLGSSKGGSAALHIGLKIKCGNIIASVPQTKIASYIQATAQDTYRDMVPKDDEENVFHKIDNYIINLLKSNHDSTIYLLTSENDYQFKIHIAPILPILNRDKRHKVTINNSICDHGDAVNFNPDYVIMSLFESVFECSISKTCDFITIIPENVDYVFSAKTIYSDDTTKCQDILQKSSINLENVLQIELSVKKNGNTIFSWNIYNWLKNSMKAKIELVKGRAVLSIYNNKKLLAPVEYALYQSSGNIVQTKYSYQKSNSFNIMLDGELIPTNFQVFCKDQYQRATNKIRVDLIQFENALQRLIFNARYNIFIENDMIHFNLLTDGYDNTYMYCFYVLKDNELFFKGNYSSQSEISLKLNKNGTYSVLYFIIHDGQREFLYSKAIEFKRTSTISIFGSCVSRDVLEYDNEKKFNLGQYVARQSIISAVSAPLKQENLVLSLDSNFQKRMVEMDLLKTSFNFLKSNPSDYLIIDLIDERFPLVCFNGSYFTASNEGINGYSLFNSLKKLYKEIKDGGLYIESNNVDGCIDTFCKKLNEIYTDDRIIIHRALLVDYYTDRNDKIVEFKKNIIKNNRQINNLLNYMYDALIAKLPGAAVIDEMAEITGDETHKWGLAPMHYQGNYYLKVLKRLVEITGEVNE